ncbi:hypothetical protein BUALT_Bualt19G0092700 [Buddleja alternifolia]|uniref:Uncharacterized protein n=1 Tax=Buddleja alternifolia TaxID=168488 RepID=A0AAV6W8A6_9LAMI|nr:hypothetical protein BUALT_Bualt19G0092700 [Buddleja alternifolia]
MGGYEDVTFKATAPTANKGQGKKTNTRVRKHYVQKENISQDGATATLAPTHPPNKSTQPTPLGTRFDILKDLGGNMDYEGEIDIQPGGKEDTPRARRRLIPKIPNAQEEPLVGIDLVPPLPHGTTYSITNNRINPIFETGQHSNSNEFSEEDNSDDEDGEVDSNEESDDDESQENGSSTWRSVTSSKPVVCNSCRSKGSKLNKLVINPLPPPKQEIEDEISPNSSMHENMAFKVNQIGMVFGNLSFQPNTALPMMPKLKSKVVVLGGSMGHQDHLYYGTTLNSLLGQDEIQIKQEEYDYEEIPQEAQKAPSIWDPKRVQKKRRSKLPQYTLSPLQRLLDQLRDVSNFHPKPKSFSTSCEAAYDKSKHAKYDDVLIYEKCKFVAENEIGVGAMLLSQPSKKHLFKPAECSTSSTNNLFEKREAASAYSTKKIKQEPSTSDSTDAYSSLVDVPIRSSPSK